MKFTKNNKLLCKSLMTFFLYKTQQLDHYSFDEIVNVFDPKYYRKQNKKQCQNQKTV